MIKGFIAVFSLIVVILVGVVVYLNNSNNNPTIVISDSVSSLLGLTPPVLKPESKAVRTIFVPVMKTSTTTPVVTAKNTIVYHPESSIILYATNENDQVPIASTTKIMTALVALELYGLGDEITVTNANESIGQKSDLQPGESWQVHELLYALLLSSGNDAAVTLAQHHPDGYAAFVHQMNEVSKRLGLHRTHFANVSGIDQEGHVSSALDLAKLTQAALSHSVIREIVKTPKFVITDTTGKISRNLVNLNQLLTTMPGVEGVKTGTTPLAGECLVTSIVQDGHQLIVVVLGSTDRYSDTKQLINWAFATHEWVETAAVE